MKKVLIIFGILLMVHSLSTWKVFASEIRTVTTSTTTTTCLPVIFCEDADLDGYGNPNERWGTCDPAGVQPPPSYILDCTDCDDTDFNVHPEAPELPCDNKDNNCNGQTDEVLGTYAYYGDEDGDGYGNPNFILDFACPPPPPGWVDNNLDCNDYDNTIYPGAPEQCNGYDDNCNGQADEGLIHTFCLDADGDGYGDPNNWIDTCDPSAHPGYILDCTDCDDSNPAVHDNCCQCPADSSLGCIFGTMYYVPNGLAVPGVTVKLKRLFPRPRVEMEVATDDDGCYRFTDLEDGIYKIKVNDCKGSSGTIVIADGRKVKKNLGWWHNRRLTKCFYRVED